MGYPGMLWVHGIDYSQRELALKMIYSGDVNVRNIKDVYAIDYIVVGPRELNDLKIKQDFFEDNFCIAKQTKNYKIYKTTPCQNI